MVGVGAWTDCFVTFFFPNPSSESESLPPNSRFLLFGFYAIVGCGALISSEDFCGIKAGLIGSFTCGFFLPNVPPSSSESFLSSVGF